MTSELTLTDTLVTASVQPAVDLDYAKQHIRALGSTDDLLIQTFIEAATSYFEEQTGRQLITATREAWLDAFPFVGRSGKHARIELPHPPLLSVSAVQYIDANGMLQDFTDGGSPETAFFTTSTPVGPYARRGSVEPLYGMTWPMARCETGAVRIRYTCGYGLTPDDIPPLVRGVLCFLVGHFDAYRSATLDRTVAEIPYGVRMMLDGFKYSALPSQVLRQYAGWIPNAAMWWWPR